MNYLSRKAFILFSAIRSKLLRASGNQGVKRISVSVNFDIGIPKSTKAKISEPNYAHSKTPRNILFLEFLSFRFFARTIFPLILVKSSEIGYDAERRQLANSHST